MPIPDPPCPRHMIRTIPELSRASDMQNPTTFLCYVRIFAFSDFRPSTTPSYPCISHFMPFPHLLLHLLANHVHPRLGFPHPRCISSISPCSLGLSLHPGQGLTLVRAMSAYPSFGYFLIWKYFGRGRGNSFPVLWELLYFRFSTLQA